MVVVIDGKSLAKEVRLRVRAALANWPQEVEVPGLDVILVGDDPASQVYVRSKARVCERLGIRSRIHRLAATISQDALLAQIDSLNQDHSVDGILLQLPLPKGLDADAAIQHIDPAKDVDGLHPVNLGRLVAGLPGLQPCTPSGCMVMLDSLQEELQGKHAVVIGRSLLVGKPIALLLLARHATVTICHSRTQELATEVGRADIVIAAVGRPGLVPGAWLKEGAIVIDVGINRIDDGSLVGDVAYESASQKASAITPVPGGVGPMTIAMLMHNTLQAAQWRRADELAIVS